MSFGVINKKKWSTIDTNESTKNEKQPTNVYDIGEQSVLARSWRALSKSSVGSCIPCTHPRYQLNLVYRQRRVPASTRTNTFYCTSFIFKL